MGGPEGRTELSASASTTRAGSRSLRSGGRRQDARLRRDNCCLPATGWGLIEFSDTRSAAGRDWTDHGDVRGAGSEGRPEERGPAGANPPELVALLGLGEGIAQGWD